MKRFISVLLCTVVVLSAKSVPDKDLQVRIGKSIQFGGVNAKMVRFGGFSTPECKLAISNEGRYFYLTKVNSTCTKITNSKGVKIICNSDKSVCKTREELIKFVKGDLDSFSEQRNKFISKEDERKHYSKFEKWLYNNCFLKNNKEKSAIWSTSYCKCYVKAIIETYRDANGYNKYFANSNVLKYEKRASKFGDKIYFCLILADNEEYEIKHPKESKEIDKTLSALSQSSNDSLKSEYSQPAWCNSSNLNKTEHTICASDTLSTLDMKLADAYGASKAHKKDVAQRAWLKKRNRCRYDVECIKKAYEDRLEELVKLKSNSVNKENKDKEEPLLENLPLKEQKDTLGIKGDYLETSGCQDSHGYGMAEDAWKIIQSDGKYYVIDFDIRCGKDVMPYFIHDSHTFAGLHTDLMPMKIQEKHQFTIGRSSQIFMQKSDYIIIPMSEKLKEKAKKYLLKIKDKDALSDIEKKNKRKAKKMLNPDGYIAFVKPIDAKYQRVFEWALTFAMIEAINDIDVETIEILLKSKEKINECVTNGDQGEYKTSYEVLEERKEEIDNVIKRKKVLNIKVPDNYKEAKKKISEIYKLFKAYGQTGTCKDQKTKKQKHISSIKKDALDQEVLKNVKKSMHYILDRDIKAFTNITDSGRVVTRRVVERLIGDETSWKKNFSFLSGMTHADIDTLKIDKKADRDKERTCRLATGKKVPCKSLEYCFSIDDKILPKKGCLDMYYINQKIYWEPYGW